MIRRLARARSILVAVSACFSVLLLAIPGWAQTCPTEADLLGTWDWVQSTGGKEGRTTPAPPGTPVQIEFGPAGKLRVGVGGVALEGQWSLRCTAPGPAELTLAFDAAALPAGVGPFLLEPETFGLELPGPGQMRLRSRILDGYDHDFVRSEADFVPVETGSWGAVKARW